MEFTNSLQETHQEMRWRTWTFLRWHRTCRGQRLRPLNRLPNFY